jgi:quinol-cytochrome oxidoreductase complex cytochrome b subunit
VPAVLIPLIVIHVSAVLAKLGVFFVIPWLDSVEQVRRFVERYRPVEKAADWILWLTGAGLIAFTSWRILLQTWMLVSIGLYLVVFLAVRFALTRELENIAESKKLYARDELKRLRTNNWCVGILSVVLLGIIAYLMMTQP